MLSLSDLPTELLLSILRHASSSQDLRSIGLTCKKLHDVANGLLYANISLDWSTCRETSPNGVTLLLRSLVGNPKLGGLVKDLHLDGRDFCSRISWSILTPPICVDALDLDTIAGIIHDFQVPHAEEWEREARRGKMDAIVTLLLSFLPNLTRLRMLSNFAKETRILSQTLISDIKASSSNKGVLPMRHSLEDVTIFRFRTGSHKVEEKNTAEILLWFYLPKIRQLNLSIDNPKDFTWPLEHAPCPRQLQSLRMSTIREPHAQQVFAACCGLKRVDWTISHRPEDPDISEPTFDMGAVTAALVPVVGTLEDLALRTAYSMGLSDIEYPEIDVRGFLEIAGFSNVRRLTLSWPLAMGIQPDRGRRLALYIPTNVEALTIMDGLDRIESPDGIEWDEYSMLEAMEEYLLSYRAHTPSLQRFDLKIEDSDDKWSPRMRKELKHICAGVGLECEVVHTAGGGRGPRIEIPPSDWVWRAPQ